MMIRKCAYVLSVLVLAVVAPVCLAAQSGMAERLAACSQERDDALRLACYDREAAQLAVARQQATPADASVNTNTPESKAESQSGSAEDGFGVYGSEVARQRGAQGSKAEGSKTDTKLKRLTATVTAVSQRPRGELVVTLGNGQVWLQKTPESYFPIKIGDEVSITRGALNSFYLAAASRSTQVTRIQ